MHANNEPCCYWVSLRAGDTALGINTSLGSIPGPQLIVIFWSLFHLTTTMTKKQTFPPTDDPSRQYFSDHHPDQWDFPHFRSCFPEGPVNTALNDYQNALSWISKHLIDSTIRHHVATLRKEWKKVCWIIVYSPKHITNAIVNSPQVWKKNSLCHLPV